MSNFGVRDLRVVNPYSVAFREAKSAVGAASLLKNAREYRDVGEAVKDCTLVVGTTAGRSRELQHPLRPLHSGANLIRRRALSGRVALLFGSEKRGLSNDDLSFCQWLMRVPTREQHPSMNLGQAVAVCLYELARAEKATAKADARKLAPAAELDRVTSVLFNALRASGYLKTDATAAAQERTRRLIRRLNLSSEDSAVLLGMLRQMLWKMRGSKKISAP